MGGFGRKKRFGYKWTTYTGERNSRQTLLLSDDIDWANQVGIDWANQIKCLKASIDLFVRATQHPSEFLIQMISRHTKYEETRRTQETYDRNFPI